MNDLGDVAGMTPYLKCIPSVMTLSARIHAGGLRYHGMAPLVVYCIMRVLSKLNPISK